MMTPLVVALVAVLINLALIPLTKRAVTAKTRTFHATVTDRRRETSVIYAGFFTPTVKYCLPRGGSRRRPPRGPTRRPR